MTFPADGSLERDAERAALARQVIENPLYIEAFGTIEQETINLWRAARDAQDREQLHQFLMMLGKTKAAMEAVIRSGDVAQAEIQRKRSKAEQIGAEYQRRWAA